MRGSSHIVGAPNLVGLVLYPAATVSAAGTTYGNIFGADPNPNPALGEYQTGEFLMECTAAATDGTDSLDVYIQTTLDPAPTASSNWVDIVHFAQVVGSATPPKRYIDKIVYNAALTEFENATALAASNARAIFGDAYRVKVVAVSGNSAAFTFSVTSNWK